MWWRRRLIFVGSVGTLAAVSAATSLPLPGPHVFAARHAWAALPSAGLSLPQPYVFAARHGCVASPSTSYLLGESAAAVTRPALNRERGCPSQSHSRLRRGAIGSTLAASQPRADTPSSANTDASDTDVRALIDAGRYVDAEKLALARIASLEASNAAVADTLDLVLLARHLGRRLTQTDTLALADRALRIREAASGPDDPRLASTLVLAGLARAAHRHPEEARRAATRGLAIREKALGAVHADVANALNAIAWIERISGRYDDAMNAASRALSIARRAERPAGRETAVALSLLGYIAHNSGDLDTAVRHFEEGVSIEERFYGAAHPAFLYSLLQLGNVYWDAGDLDRSRDVRERAVRGLEHVPGSEYRLAFELMLHSNWMNRIGDYAASLALAERAASFAERAAGARSALAAAALDQVAITHGLLGNHAAAIAINEKAVALWSESQGPESQHAATAWRTLAVAYEEAGRVDDALEAIEHALTNPSFAKEPIRASEAMLVKSSLLVTRGRLDEARALMSEFRRVNEQIAYFGGRLDLANAFTLLGRVERHQGQAARAVPFYRDALRLTEQHLGPANPATAVKRTELAGVLAEAGERAEARGLLVEGERASLDHLRLLARALPDQAALTFAATRTSGLNLAVTLAAADRGDIDLAFDLLIRGRTVILDEMAARHQAVMQGASDATLRERWTTLNRARTRLANLIVRGPEQQPLDRYQALVERTREARDRAERDLAETSAAFRQELRRTRAGASEVVAHLPPGAAIVSYVRYTPQPLPGDSDRAAASPQLTLSQAVSPASSRAPSPEAASPQTASSEGASPRTAAPQAYAAFVARVGRPVAIVRLGDADRIDAAIDAWRARIREELASAGLASRRTEALYRGAGGALRALVWDPVRGHLGDASTVFVVPDGALHLVDLSTLPTGVKGYLADAPLLLHYVLAERDLLQTPSTAANDSLLALGAPDFDKAERSAQRSTAPPGSGGASNSPSYASGASDASRAQALASNRVAPAPGLVSNDAAPATPVEPAPPVASNGASSLRSAAPCEAALANRFEPLPATDVEVRHIAGLWRQALPVSATATAAAAATRGVPADAGADGPASPRSSSRARDAVVLDGARASETAFKTLARGRRVLHLATHGFFLDRNCAPTAHIGAPVASNASAVSAAPGATTAASASGAPTASGARDAKPAHQRMLEESPLLRSGLVLAGANGRSRTHADASADAVDDDGILTAEEIAGLDLSAAQWAVLSACDTGRGDWQAGEGVLGLRRAFQMAGARTVILSLWPVLDDVTARWMTALYRGKWASRRSTAAAVRAANRALLAERRANGESTHPLYWSGFIATGDWR